jgi:hypothetical protein
MLQSFGLSGEMKAEIGTWISPRNPARVSEQEEGFTSSGIGSKKYNKSTKDIVDCWKKT